MMLSVQDRLISHRVAIRPPPCLHPQRLQLQLVEQYIMAIIIHNIINSHITNAQLQPHILHYPHLLSVVEEVQVMVQIQAEMQIRIPSCTHIRNINTITTITMQNLNKFRIRNLLPRMCNLHNRIKHSNHNCNHGSCRSRYMMVISMLLFNPVLLAILLLLRQCMLFPHNNIWNNRNENMGLHSRKFIGMDQKHYLNKCNSYKVGKLFLPVLGTLPPLLRIVILQRAVIW